MVRRSSGSRRIDLMYWLLLLAASLTVIRAGNVSITGELLNGYTIRYPGLSIPFAEAIDLGESKRSMIDDAVVQASLVNETVHPPNTIYAIPIAPGEEWDGQTDWARHVQSEHERMYGKDTVYLEKPAWAGNFTKRSTERSKRLTERSRMTQSTSDMYLRTQSVPHGNIWPADFARSLCYDRCGWNQDCDANNMLVWTTNYIHNNQLYKNVQLRGRIYGKINYAWSDDVKWRTRDMLCETLVNSMNNARIIVTEGQKTGCVGNCNGPVCQRFGCETARLEMFHGPAGGSLTLAAWWDDGGYSTPGWISWSIEPVSSPKLGGICGSLGVALGWLAFLPGIGAFFGIAGIGVSAACTWA